MTTNNNFRDNAVERDNDLVRALCHTIERGMVRDLRDWIEAELKELIFEAQIQQTETEGVLKEQLDSTIGRLQFINRLELPDAVLSCTNLIHDVREGAWADVYDAYDPMQQELGKLVQIVRSLLEIRAFIAPIIHD